MPFLFHTLCAYCFSSPSRETLLLSHTVFQEQKYKTLWKSNNFKYLLDSNQETGH